MQQSASQDDHTIMWGYSPNFNMKKRRSLSSGSTVRQFNLADEDLNGKQSALQEKIKAL